MAHFFVIPAWFYGIDIFMEFIFAMVAALVALFSYRIYKISSQRELRLLGTGFLMISISEIIKGYVELFILHETSEGLRILDIDALTNIGMAGVYAHFILYIAGLVTLAYLTFGIRSKRAYSLLMVTNLAPLILSTNKELTFSLLSVMLVGYIVVHYLLVYSDFRHRNKRVLLVLIAFTSLLLGEIGLVFTPQYYLNYVYSHVLELLAYLLILISLTITIKGSHAPNNTNKNIP